MHVTNLITQLLQLSTNMIGTPILMDLQIVKMIAIILRDHLPRIGRDVQMGIQMVGQIVAIVSPQMELNG